MITLTQKIKKYYTTQNYEDFNTLERKKVFNHDTQTLTTVDGYVFYVDWREYDDAIVEYCEDLIKTGLLKAKREGDFLLIDYKDETFKLSLIDADSRDPTIIFINQILLPEYEIRFCTITHGSDTLGFIVLSTTQWRHIESEIPKKELDKLFEPINENSKMFERDF